MQNDNINIYIDNLIYDLTYTCETADDFKTILSIIRGLVNSDCLPPEYQKVIDHFNNNDIKPHFLTNN